MTSVGSLTWNDVVWWRNDFDNVGDGPLNDYLMPRLFPMLSADTGNPRAVFMGIGSILGFRRSHLPRAWQELPWIIFGSGYQYGRLTVPPRSCAFALRGAQTARLLPHLDPIALADPAILLPLHLPRDVESRPGRTGVVVRYDWRGHRSHDVFDTRTGGDFVGWMRKLWGYERIVTDSFHAAVFADAYGIPWVPMRWELKWADHFATDAPREFTLTDRRRLATMQEELIRAAAALNSALSDR